MQYLSEFDVETSHSIEIAAAPRDVYPHVRNLDLSSSKVSRALFIARGITGMPRLNQVIGKGVTLLRDDPPRHLALGLAGKFWTIRGGRLRLTAQEFAGFAEPGYAKAVLTLDLIDAKPGTRLGTTTRVNCLDAESRKKFLRYWRLIGPFSGVIRKEALKAVKRAAES